MKEYIFKIPASEKMRVTVDEGSNAIHVYLDPDNSGVPGKVAITSTIASGCNIDQDADGVALGIEIL